MNKFARFISYLEKNDKKMLELSFEEIERINGVKLCNSAYKHREYWNPSGHLSIPNYIVEAGYIIKDVDLINKKIVLIKK